MGGKHATSTSTVSIPKQVMDNYTSVYNRAETAASQPFKAFGNTASDYVAQMNAQQNAGIADINATAGSYQPYMTQATSATQAGMGPAYEGIENYMSPYTKNVADTTGAMMRQQQEQAQSGALGTAAMSGAFGGDRAGIAAANLQQQNQMGYGKTMADIMNQGYTQALGASQADLARQLQGGAQMAALGAQSQQLGLQGAQAKLAAGTLQQQTEQAGKDAMINRFMQEQGFPYQQAQFLANIAMGTGALSGSTTTTQTPRNWMGYEQGGRVDGYADGGGVAGPMEFSKSGLGGQSYVPEGNLPVGELMVAEPPQDQGGGGQQTMQMLQMAMGAARGGVIDARHGYATDGFVYEGPNSALGRDQAALYGPRQMMTRDHYLQPGRDGQIGGDFMPPSATGVAPAPNPRLDAYLADRRQEPVAAPPRVGLMPAQIQRNPEYSQNPLANLTQEQLVSHPPATTLGDSPQEPVAAPYGMPNRPISLTPRSGLAPTESPRPPLRPAGGVAGAEDIAADTMAILGNKPAPTGVAAPNAGPQTNTGVAPEGGYAPIIPLKTQLQFVTNELQQPEYSGFLKQTYASPADAATAFDTVYEKSKGANDGLARANANDIYNAVQNGNLENLPPNVVEAYNHFVQNGMDPIQASGAAGRLMVESYAHLDPNARNTIGGGMGTYGIAQWRGDRIEKLADFAGVPMENIVNAPVSTPEGRYYSTKGDSSGVAGPNAATPTSGDNTGLAAGVKPYEERTAIGKFFHNPEGGMNTNAVLSLLAGIGRAAEAPTISPLGAILSGVATGADTYNTLRNEEPKRVAEVMANSQAARMNYMQAVEMGETRPFDQWAKAQYGTGVGSMVGEPAPGSGAAATVMSGGNPSFDIAGKGLSAQIELPNGGGTVSVSQNYKALSDYENAIQPMAALGNATAISTMERIRALKEAIVAKGGTVYDVSGTAIQDPTYIGMVNAGELAAQGRAATLEFNKQKADRSYVLDQNINEIDNQANIFSELNAGALANERAKALAIGIALGFPVPEGSSDYVSAVQESVKNAGRKTLQRLESTAPAAEMERLRNIIEDPSMQPEAIKVILSLQKAEASRELARYTLRDQWNAANPQLAMDQMAYDKWFADSEPFSKYYESAKKNMPIFAGELGSAQKPHPLGTRYENIGVGESFVLPNLSIGKRKS